MRKGISRREKREQRCHASALVSLSPTFSLTFSSTLCIPFARVFFFLGGGGRGSGRQSGEELGEGKQGKPYRSAEGDGRYVCVLAFGCKHNYYRTRACTAFRMAIINLGSALAFALALFTMPAKRQRLESPGQQGEQGPMQRHGGREQQHPCQGPGRYLLYDYTSRPPMPRWPVEQSRCRRGVAVTATSHAGA